MVTMHKLENIICGKLDNFVSLDPANKVDLEKIVRISATNPNKLKKIDYTPFSTNGSIVFYENKVWTVDDFLDEITRKKKKHLIALTSKEVINILEKSAARNIHISILEIAYPIFSDIKYSSNLRANYLLLLKLLKKIDHLGILGPTFASDQTARHLYSIARKLRFKNGFDKFFFFAYKEGYQEVFKLTEERNDRKIIAFDFNSMFAYCMGGSFCEPKSIYHVKVNSNKKPELLADGIYHVILRGAKNSWFLGLHPFLFKRFRRTNRFRLEENGSVETILYKDEIIFYSKFFQEVVVLEGLCSDGLVEH